MNFSAHTISSRTRQILLTVYVLLSFLILEYPMKYFYSFSQVESLNVIVQAPLFTAIYSIWIVTYVGISFVAKKLSSVIITLVIVIFSVTSNLLTYEMAPLGLDHNYFITNAVASYISDFHHIPVPPPSQLWYLSYPGLMILTSLMKELVFSYPATEAVLESAIYIIIGLSVYLISLKLISDVRIAALAVPSFFSLSLGTQLIILFFPATMGFALLAVSFFMLFSAPNSTKRSLVIIILMAAMTVTHFFDPLIFLTVLVSIAFFSRLTKRVLQILPVQVSMISFIFFAGYFLFVSVLVAHNLILSVEHSIWQLLTDFSVSYASQVVVVNSLSVPLWASVTRYFDLVAMSILGSVAAIMFLITARKRDDRLLWYSEGTIGILAIGLIAFAASISSGGGDLIAAADWVTLLSIPMALFVLSKYRFALVLLLICLIAFSASTQFSLRYSQVSTITMYPSELSAANFFIAHKPNGNFTISTDYNTYGAVATFYPLVIPLLYSLPVNETPYVGGSYNIVNQLFSRYQLHLYGYPINYSLIYQHDVVFNDGIITISPP